MHKLGYLIDITSLIIIITFIMPSSRNQHYKIQYKIRYLGVHIDNKLIWKSHTDTIVNKANRVKGLSWNSKCILSTLINYLNSIHNTQSTLCVYQNDTSRCGKPHNKVKVMNKSNIIIYVRTLLYYWMHRNIL